MSCWLQHGVSKASFEMLTCDPLGPQPFHVGLVPGIGAILKLIVTDWVI